MRVERGLFWVEDDIECAAVLFEQVKSIEKHVLPYVTDFSVCIQAGGNCGLFPLTLAKRFGHVYTAEPDPANYAVLLANTKTAPNVTAFPCAWGEYYTPIGVSIEPGNCGATYVVADGDIAQSTIDDLGLATCGLIYLDVEGFEEFALRGAERTIHRFRPVIVAELKGLAARYGRTDKDCADYLRTLGYCTVHRFDNDVIFMNAMVHKE